MKNPHIMKAILLDGSHANNHLGERIRAALIGQLHASGWEVNPIVLRERKIGNCAGDFFCWVRSPGTCHIDDDNRGLAAAVMASDLMVYLTPVTFGGYSSALKRMVDHQIQNISPFFAKIGGETHHQKRYERYPDFLAVGWIDPPDPRAETVFRHLVKRNGINLYAENTVCGVALAGQSDEEILASVRAWLTDLRAGRPTQAVNLPAGVEISCSASAPRRALLLVGSPKARKSTSNSLGQYLFDQLKAQSMQTETVYLHTTVRSHEKMKGLMDALDAADLVTLVFPVYVDSLPAPVIEVLERVAAHRQSRGRDHRPLFIAISNSGFPEAGHNATALAICEIFARQAEFEWAGSLGLGGGQGLVADRPLEEGGGRTVRIRKGLKLAAAALAQGQAIPKAAQDLIAKPVIPAWAYRLMGGLGWKHQAKRHRAGRLLRSRPYSA
jgi:multimeric flavodoxin WrbA